MPSEAVVFGDLYYEDDPIIIESPVRDSCIIRLFRWLCCCLLSNKN
jgi:hypothetical protein